MSQRKEVTTRMLTENRRENYNSISFTAVSSSAFRNESGSGYYRSNFGFSGRVSEGNLKTDVRRGSRKL